jgi:hypothetical protein
MHAELCPVCKGNGKYYGLLCHGCGGKGWVEVNDSVIQPFYPYTPYTPYYTYSPWYLLTQDNVSMDGSTPLTCSTANVYHLVTIPSLYMENECNYDSCNSHKNTTPKKNKYRE